MPPPLIAGAARVEITPPLGIPTGGGGPDGYMRTEYVLDPLYARALLLTTPDCELALVQADLLGLGQAKADSIAAAVARQTGLPASHVIVVCPQSHNSGTTFNNRYPDPVLTEFVSSAHREWYEGLETRMAGAAAAAAHARRPVHARILRGAVAGVSANRRATLHNGEIRMAWSDPDPAAIAGWGPEDTELLLLRLEDADSGAPMAFLWHFTGHPNSLWMLPCFSRDYPGVVEDRLLLKYPTATALFFNGFCGDMDTYRYMGVTKQVYTYPFYKEPGLDLSVNIRAMQRLGTQLAAQVLQLETQLAACPPLDTTLDIRRAHLTCPLREDAPVDTAHYSPDVEVAAWRLGPVAFAAAPFEPVAALGLELKRRSPLPFTFTVGHTPASRGYLPDQRALDQGGFEAGTNWRGYAAGTGEQVCSALVQLLQDLSTKTG